MNECFERTLKESIKETPEFYYFNSSDFKDLFTKTDIEIYDGIKDYDLLVCIPSGKENPKYYNLYVDLYGYDEAGHCAYFPKRDYDFSPDGVDLELWQKILPQRRALLGDKPVLEVFNLQDLWSQIRRALFGLSFNYTEEDLFREYQNILKTKGDIKKPPTQNRIVKMFQQHLIFGEQLVYQNPERRRYLIQNRMKYLFKPEHLLTDHSLIGGCSISKMCQTYSFFSPLWFKYFIEKYNVKSVYDPFGGWGHRLLGSSNLDLYIYNDNSALTYNGVKNIAEFLNLKNVEFYNENAEDFKPKEQYEAVFTCPPYDDVEVYEHPIINFSNLLKEALNCGDKLYGVVLLEKFEHLLDIHELIEKTPVNTGKSHFGKNNFEFLYVFR